MLKPALRKSLGAHALSLVQPMTAPRLAEVIPFPKAPTDAELVRRIVDGDARAHGLVWDRYATTLRGILRRSLGPSAEVDDALQEVFIRFFRAPNALRDAAALRSFLIGVAMRVAASELRSKKLRRWFLLDRDEALPESPSNDASLDGDAREAVRRLYLILNELDNESRLLFVLRHVEDLELTDVADALSISLATVKRKLARVTPVVFARIKADPTLRSFVDESMDTTPLREVLP
jgi:RNA polymerase sigma-70 factor, ECF subfamily